MRRVLHLALYDVCAARRLRRVARVVRDYAAEGQRSAYECWLGRGEAAGLLGRVQQVIEGGDAFVLIRLTQPMALYQLGRARAAPDASGPEALIYLG